MNLSSKLTGRVRDGLLLAIAGVFVALRYLHLTADFPNHSPWMDWAKYTDEGWYGDAAIRHFQLGHWYLWGDFNPAVALPVWPLLEAGLFHFTGVSLAAARALTVTLFAGILALTWLLATRTSSAAWLTRHALPEPAAGDRASFAPAVTVLLLAVSPFCFAFSRLAVIEPLLVLLMLLALLTAAAALPVGPQPSRVATLRLALRQNAHVILGLGVLLPVMILAKTTAVFLVPALAWMLFAALGRRWQPWVAVGGAAALLGATLWLAYYLLLVRPHYLEDYRYLFAANAYTQITAENALEVIMRTVQAGLWIGPVVYGTALVFAVVALAMPRRLVREPLIPALLLWAAGYAAFLAYHNNIQPRYYFVIAVPVTLLTPLVLERLLLPRLPLPVERLGLLAVAGVLFAAVVLPGAVQTVGFVRHPEYTLVDAAHAIQRTIAADLQQEPRHSPLVLSISGSDLSLMTGLPSIDDDFGTLELADRARFYRPGWYLAWNAIEDDKMDALTPTFAVTRVATFPAMDDPDRNQLILYRLDATGDAAPTQRVRRGNAPRHFGVRMGQSFDREQSQH